MLSERPLTASIGAEIEGIDLRQPVSADLAGRLRAALARHQVLFLRDQHLSLDQLKALTRAFGEPMQLPYVAPLEGEPEVIRVLKEADERGGVFGGDWHTDFSFLETPPAGSILAGEVIPPVGGDTLWAGSAAAWEALPGPLQALLAGRDAIHVGKPYGVKWAPPPEERSGGSITMARGDPTADAERRHPAVLRNPVTGRAALFLNPTYVARLDGLSEAESRPLLAQIQQHATRPEFVCRFRWTPGAVAIWDNLFTQHYAVNDYHGHRRLMHRTTFSGPRPRNLAAFPPPRAA
ncbi:MAG TPA: TauD/TfdA family dioxygenase [Thermohalobaculum sp.]|nr:TauD/TfdA family dioxygenase [Thermohalobaculum sp.]